MQIQLPSARLKNPPGSQSLKYEMPNPFQLMNWLMQEIDMHAKLPGLVASLRYAGSIAFKSCVLAGLKQHPEKFKTSRCSTARPLKADLTVL